MHKKDRSANGRSIVFIAFAAAAILIMTSSVLIAVQNTDGEPVGNGIVVDGLRYDIHGDGTATSTGLDDSYASASLTIPDTIEYNGKEYRVTAVGEKAFYYCEYLLGSLVIGKNVETIGNLAFNHCGFLGTLTFKGDNLRSIGFGAFDSCRFAGDLTIPSKVTSIGDCAFRYCYVGGTLTLGTNIQKIGWNAFLSCGFKNIFIGSGNVEYHAFGYCENMEKITVAKGVSLSPDAFTRDFCNEDRTVIKVDQIPGYVYTYEDSGRPIMVRQSAIYTVFLDDGFGKKLPPIVGTGTTELPIIEHPPLEFEGWFDGEKVYAPGEDYNITKNITLQAIWNGPPSPGFVNVMSFNLNGGTDNDTGTFNAKKISAGETYNLPSEIPVRTGYIFGGWECNGSTYQPGASVKMDSDMVFKAKWTPISYKIIFRNGSDTAEQDFKYDVFEKLRKNTWTKADYVFLGWSTTEGGAVTYVDEFTVGNLTIVDGKEIDLYAVWDEKEPAAANIVSFDLKGGEGDFPALKTDKDSKVTLPDRIPAKEGYIFKEWKSGDKTYQKGDVIENVNADMTLEAVWIPICYEVKYHSGTETPYSQPLIYDTAENLYPNIFVKEGFAFKGWCLSSDADKVNYADEQTVKNLASEMDAVVDLYAVWEAAPVTEYILSFDPAKGEGSFPIMKVTDGKAVLYDAPALKGYIFGGWECKGETYAAKQEIAVTSDMSFKAKWTPITYKVIFDYGTKTVQQDFVYDVPQKLIKNTVTKEGYVFLGWSTTEGGAVTYVDQFEVVNLTTEDGKDIYLYPVWNQSEPAETNVVTFDSNGGQGSFPVLKADEDGKVTLPNTVPSREGYKFGGWQSGEKIYQKGAVIENIITDIVLTAVWTPIKYKVEFNNAGDKSYSQEFTYDVPDSLIPLGFSKEGFAFKGWSVENDGTVNFLNENEVVNLTSVDGGIVKLYAVWAPEMDIPEMKIAKGVDLVADMGQSVTVGAVTVTDSRGIQTKVPSDMYYASSEANGTEVTVLGGFTGTLRSGDYLLEVYTEKGTAGGVFTVKGSDPPGPVPTLKHKVIYDTAGGPDIPAEEYAEGSAFIVAGAVTKEGYKFLSWKCSDGREYKGGETCTMGKSDITFTAQWEKIPEPVPPEPEPQKDNTAMIVGIVVGVIVAVALVGGAIYFVKKK